MKIALALIVGVISVHMFSAEALDTATPATAATISTSMDGSAVINCNVPTALFNGTVPPHGFLVETLSVIVWVNDHGLAGVNSGFELYYPGGASPNLFVTPPGYKPMGPVYVFSDNCAPGNTFYVAARG
jgi:hypothetical protein